MTSTWALKLTLLLSDLACLSSLSRRMADFSAVLVAVILSLCRLCDLRMVPLGCFAVSTSGAAEARSSDLKSASTASSSLECSNPAGSVACSAPVEHLLPLSEVDLKWLGPATCLLSRDLTGLELWDEEGA